MMPEESGTELDGLPEEILVSKILVLLPPKDVGRCRAVRASWRSATSTPEFMLDHHRSQPSLPVMEREGGSLGIFRDSGSKACCQRLWPFLPCVRIHAAGHGFLVVSQSQLGSGFYICNPVIRQIAPLPQPEFRPSNNVLALYRHDTTGEYRVLWSSVVQVDCSRNEATLYVLTVGDNQSRNIGVGLSTVSSTSLEQALLEALPRGPYSSYNPPVHHRGNLHWMWKYRAEIIVFDTVAESFRLMRSATNSCSLEKLFDVEGKLAVCSPDSCFTFMDVWVMEDYAAKIWDFKYRIDVSSIEASKEKKKKTKKGTHVAPTLRFLNEMTALNERELLIGFSDKHVLRCNIDGKLLGMANIQKGQYYMELTPHHLKESILPIPTSEMQEDEEYV